MPTEVEIDALSLEEYRKLDPSYNQKILEAREGLEDVIKEIDATLYPIQDELLRFSKARNTLLQANWGQLTVLHFLSQEMQFQLVDAIKAIRAIKAKFEYSQRIASRQAKQKQDEPKGKEKPPAYSGGKADLPNKKTVETGENADKIIGDKFNLWGLEIHWRALWNKLKKPMTNLKTFLRRDK